MEMQEKVWSVTEVSANLRDIIDYKLQPFWVGGEIRNISFYGTTMYFTLVGDREQLNCVFFQGKSRRDELGIRNDMKIEAHGNVYYYAPRSMCQLRVDKIQIAGQGDLYKQFIELLGKLKAEGLTDPARKRPIPLLPRRIGVVTSLKTSAIQDFLSRIKKRFPNASVRIFPAGVQGNEAPEKIANGIKFFSRSRCVDVVAVIRGGGGMEDLQAFNSEGLARAVAGCSVPVITGIGHDTDYTICDLVADLRVETPTAAGDAVICCRADMENSLNALEQRMKNCVDGALNCRKYRLTKAENYLSKHTPSSTIQGYQLHLNEYGFALRNVTTQRLISEREKLDWFYKKLQEVARTRLKPFHEQLDRIEGTLYALNPMRQLERGYSILVDSESGKLVLTSKVPVGTRLRARLADGEMDLEVR